MVMKCRVITYVEYEATSRLREICIYFALNSRALRNVQREILTIFSIKYFFVKYYNMAAVRHF
jgi:hypothetical protein